MLRDRVAGACWCSWAPALLPPCRGAGCRLSIAVVRPMAAARNTKASLTRWISTSQVLMISFPLCRKKGGVDDPVSRLGVPGGGSVIPFAA